MSEYQNNYSCPDNCPMHHGGECQWNIVYRGWSSGQNLPADGRCIHPQVFSLYDIPAHPHVETAEPPILRLVGTEADAEPAKVTRSAKRKPSA
jgi:hypothetical protein